MPGHGAIPRPAHDPARRRARVLAVAQHLHAIDEHVAHAGRVLVRLLERGVILDRRRIEDHDVRQHALGEPPAVLDAEVLGGQRGQSADAFFERDELLIAHVPPQQSREVAVGARMRVRLRNGPSGAIEPASEAKLTHGSRSCFRRLSSDIRK